MKKSLIRRALLLLPGIAAFALYRAAFSFPDAVERVYSRAVYPVLTYISYISCPLEISLSELSLYFLAAGAVVFVFFFIKSFFAEKGRRLYLLARRILLLLTVVSMAAAMFICGWGLNYARNTLAESMELETRPSTRQELISLCEKLAGEASALRKKVDEDENGVYKMSRGRAEILKDVKELYRSYAPEILNLGAEGNVKKTVTKNILSYSETTGIFSPFTYECHVNGDIPDLYFASCAAHEYAHFKGFAREDECNFASWYITRMSGDIDFKYSGSVLALVHAMNSLFNEDRDAHRRIYGTIDDGIKRDWAFDSLYWDEFETDFSESTDRVYNSYLKGNGISDGTKSYGRMLDLILAMQRQGLM